MRKIIFCTILLAASSLFAQNQYSFGFSIHATHPTFTSERASFDANITRSFQAFDVIGKIGLLKDEQRLTQIPVTAGLRLFIIKTSLLSPYIAAGVGADYLQADNHLPGKNGEMVIIEESEFLTVKEMAVHEKGLFFSYSLSLGTLINISHNWFLNFDLANYHGLTSKNDVGQFLSFGLGVNRAF